MSDYVSAKQAENSTDRYYYYSDGSYDIYRGGSRSWRDNNPGNVHGGKNAIGKDASTNPSGSELIFPDYDTGLAAQTSVLEQDNYQSLTVKAALAKYTTEKSETALNNYIKAFVNAANANDPSNTITQDSTLSNLSESQLKAAVTAQVKAEGFKAGTIIHHALGKPSDYDIIDNKDGTWTIKNVRGSTSDKLRVLPAGEQVEFSDPAKTTYQLVPNGILDQKDLAFVIDTTGSMGPYVDAVKEYAASIISGASDNGNNDVHYSVVSFKDPTQGDPNGVVLPFTTQDDFASRNSAVEGAVNSLGADGGGDIPEDDYGGLLLALNGNAGQWRDSAGTRRIILFSDAPVKDTGVEAAVNKYAADENSAVTASSVARSPYGLKSTYTLAAPIGSSGIPETIEIDTIQVGTDPTATASLQKIATDNSGSFFDAPSPDQLQQAILKIVSEPPPNNATSATTITSTAFDIFQNHQQADTTFVFNPGYGIDVVKGFKLGGTDHDVIDLPASDFTSIADVLRNTGDVQGNAWITDPVSGDAIRLAGITTAQLKAHRQDISLHG